MSGVTTGSDRDALTAGAHTDGCGHGVASEVRLCFGFATPEPVLTIVAGEALALTVHRTGAAQKTGLGFATDSRLRRR